MGTVTVGEVWFDAHPGDRDPRHVHGKIGSGEVVSDLLEDGKGTRKNVTDSEVRKARQSRRRRVDATRDPVGESALT